MGRTKALVDVDGVPMARWVIAALRGVGCAAVTAIGGDPDELAALDIDVVADDHPGDGPLGGIATALRSCESHAGADVLVVACDLPFLGPGDLDRLVTAAGLRPDADAIVARSDRPEPGCALWRPSSHAAVRSAFDGGERAVHRVLDRLQVVEVDLPAESLRNINTPADLPRYP
jgi:molybdopterin-guanine dinucleotide biosynthesis protein A